MYWPGTAGSWPSDWSSRGCSDPRLDRIKVVADETTATLVVERPGLLILVNLGSEDHRFPLPPGAVLAASDPRSSEGDGFLLVPADAVALIEIPGI